MLSLVSLFPISRSAEETFLDKKMDPEDPNNHSVCPVPSSELGPHHHLFRKRVCPPGIKEGGGGTLASGWGGPDSDG